MLYFTDIQIVHVNILIHINGSYNLIFWIKLKQSCYLLKNVKRYYFHCGSVKTLQLYFNNKIVIILFSQSRIEI